jgi:hypothetical protein
MANPNTGIQFGVYANMISKYGDSVVRTPITKTENNLTGNEILTEGTPVSITTYIVRKNTAWKFDKEGLIQGGDAQMIVPSTVTINRDDKITWNGNTYRVMNVLNRDNGGGNVAYKSCNLFLW